MEEFAGINEKKTTQSATAAQSKKKGDEDANFIYDGDDVEEVEVVSKKKPTAKRTFKTTESKTAVETKKTKSESLESTDADSTPKKKFKYFFH